VEGRASYFYLCNDEGRRVKAKLPYGASNEASPFFRGRSGLFFLFRFSPWLRFCPLTPVDYGAEYLSSGSEEFFSIQLA